MESWTGTTTGTQRVVVGYDGSADADRGLEWAIDYARAHNAAVEVLSASGDLEYLPERTSDDIDRLVESWVARASRTLEGSGLKEWRARTSSGKSVPQLLEASDRATLLVVGAQGHGVLGGILIGSVSQHLARHARCPVAVVRGVRVPTHRIVVGVDGSAAAQQALRFGFDHAEHVGGTVVAVHGRAVAALKGPWDATVAPSVAQEMEAAERLLGEAVAGIRSEHPDVAVELLALPVPAVRALADASATASLVVVGTRGRGGFAGLLLGSVSATVLQHAQCPVVVLR
jgi:nucleotide-binding universal stress UspA family protein